MEEESVVRVVWRVAPGTQMSFIYFCDPNKHPLIQRTTVIIIVLFRVLPTALVLLVLPWLRSLSSRFGVFDVNAVLAL